MSATTSSPFTRAVVDAIGRVYPDHLADKSFDNTGLLLEAPSDPSRPKRNSVLLTNDLTSAVADEAIERKDSVVVAYHPIIFRGLKSFTLADSQQRSLLRLAAEGISVYCPHTAVDAAEGGNADWLSDIVTGEVAEPATREPEGEEIAPGYRLQHFPSSYDAQYDAVKLAAHPHTRTPITPNAHHPNAGAGRLITLTTPRPLSAILQALTIYLNNPSSFLLALPPTVSSTEASTDATMTEPNSTTSTTFPLSSATAFPLATATTVTPPSAHPITSIAICCGSGGSTFSKLSAPADLYITGEMVHHEALAVTENGGCVVVLGHSNSERAYLGAVMRGKLEEEIGRGWGDIVEVEVSRMDRDPFGWVVRG